jgi:hypothetical protein
MSVTKQDLERARDAAIKAVQAITSLQMGMPLEYLKITTKAVGRLETDERMIAQFSSEAQRLYRNVKDARDAMLAALTEDVRSAIAVGVAKAGKDPLVTMGEIIANTYHHAARRAAEVCINMLLSAQMLELDARHKIAEPINPGPEPLGPQRPFGVNLGYPSWVMELLGDDASCIPQLPDEAIDDQCGYIWALEKAIRDFSIMEPVEFIAHIRNECDLAISSMVEGDGTGAQGKATAIDYSDPRPMKPIDAFTVPIAELVTHLCGTDPIFRKVRGKRPSRRTDKVAMRVKTRAGLDSIKIVARQWYTTEEVASSLAPQSLARYKEKIGQ